jgi:hypothetical protein
MAIEQNGNGFNDDVLGDQTSFQLFGGTAQGRNADRREAVSPEGAGERAAHFKRFEEGTVVLYSIGPSASAASLPPITREQPFPSFTLRKVDDRRAAIVTWMTREKAQEFLDSCPGRSPSAEVVEIRHADLERILKGARVGAYQVEMAG